MSADYTNALHDAIRAEGARRGVADMGDLYAFTHLDDSECIQWNTATHEASATLCPGEGWCASLGSEDEGENYDCEPTTDVDRLARILVTIMCPEAT